MNNIKDALWQDYDDVENLIGDLVIGNEDYDVAVKERDNIRNELLKFEQLERETEVKKSQIEAENKREWIRNVITIGTFGISTIVSVCLAYKTFKFDEESTVSSTLGRGILNSVIPKPWKR